MAMTTVIVVEKKSVHHQAKVEILVLQVLQVLQATQGKRVEVLPVKEAAIL